jgi:hypothetical protein
MKKSIIFIIALVCAATAMAQAPDTIDSRYDSCYYTRWYDTCRSYLNGQQAELRGFETHSHINTLTHSHIPSLLPLNYVKKCTFF